MPSVLKVGAEGIAIWNRTLAAFAADFHYPLPKCQCDNSFRLFRKLRLLIQVDLVRFHSILRVNDRTITT
jgi:hypothetical protein